ncbi:MAG: class I SAM-dependent methyltransferase [Clostridiales Family XIII bacterium]|jgi:SAM-dependent methyltransferase|nr:class I SAM-dependent methyltransferase [Clostridiales Family XIII bacterium]
METDRNIFYKQAGAYTAFHKKLGVLLEPYLDKRWDVVDIGCGLAFIDFEIAPHVKSVTAVDIDAEIIDEVKEQIDEKLWGEHARKAEIAPIVADWKCLDDAAWDVVMTCFYSVPFDEMKDLLAKGRRRAILIVHGRKPNGKFDPLEDEARKCTAEDMESYLKREGYRYRKNVAELQFGQPFKTIEDIHLFLNQFPGFAGPVLDEDFDPEKHMLSTEERIIKTNRYDYPYYLPKSFNVAIFVVVK